MLLRTHYESPFSSAKTNHEVPLVPNCGYGTDRFTPFHVGIDIIGCERGPWQVNRLGGVSFISSRSIAPARNQVFPGRYEFDRSTMGIEVARLLGTESRTSC
ncbi:MAG: hypothetical protein HOP18_17100 [Deltaproteobacteria bacterium]|nr:hypothetical protein [Deltaproteobacteria bacterium]